MVLGVDLWDRELRRVILHGLRRETELLRLQTHLISKCFWSWRKSSALHQRPLLANGITRS